MKNPFRNKPESFWLRVEIIVELFGLVVLLTMLGTYAAGARINRTNSLPQGLYWLVDKEPERGDIVSFWPDGSEPFQIARERNYITPGQYYDRGDGGYSPIMKKLMGLPGDIVSITDDGVFINGDLIRNSRPFACDSIGDPLPVVRLHEYRLRENEVLLVSDYLPRSFDARYFGIQDKKQILDVLEPVFTW
jgi:conjugative transfer signal peptidase TraF